MRYSALDTHTISFIRTLPTGAAHEKQFIITAIIYAAYYEEITALLLFLLSCTCVTRLFFIPLFTVSTMSPLKFLFLLFRCCLKARAVVILDAFDLAVAVASADIISLRVDMRSDDISYVCAADDID